MFVFRFNGQKRIYFGIFPCKWRGYKIVLWIDESLEKFISSKYSFKHRLMFLQWNILAIVYIKGKLDHKKLTNKPKLSMILLDTN